eukprot:CAMPEP_0182426282 /NCGR_PEP_ID=MMETSP1167-20130531/12772_1 /TAXON_ID=2988 /ORGANISM="Mallomonas Sp, Strain CCMP3275" /LENGTH=411 /DNA_ID=CAMNT_0024607611 /DNA_START=120 /DNA_END=1355 /DNA_ORIENTATION=-
MATINSKNRNNISSNVFEFDQERPITPPELRKFRRAAQETGKRYVHPGQIEDLKKLDLESRCFGGKKPVELVTAKALISAKPQNTVEKLNSLKGEMYSKSHQLGKSLKLGTLPNNFDTDRVRGVSTRSDFEHAKDIIFPQATEDPNKGEEHYKKSHASFQPGEQKTRGYDWSIDPNEVRFGKKSEIKAYNGISKGVTEALSGGFEENAPVISRKALEDYREMGDALGCRRNRGLQSVAVPPDHSFGRHTTQDEWTAAKILQGTYSDKEQKPDPDLGKTLTPGFRNISTNDRIFGCPTIRTDLKKANKSIADSQAYGDDVGAKDLISPAPFSDMAVPPDAFISGKSKEYLLTLFDNIDFPVPDYVADIIFDIASDGEEYATIVNFRAVLNEYILACENGAEERWLKAKQNGF